MSNSKILKPNVEELQNIIKNNIQAQPHENIEKFVKRNIKGIQEKIIIIRDNGVKNTLQEVVEIFNSMSDREAKEHI